MKKNIIERLIRVGINKYLKKTIKGFEKCPFIAMSKFWGFPIGLNTLPVVTANIIARIRGFAGIFCFFAR